MKQRFSRRAQDNLRPAQSESGLTLIEILIAVSLLSLLSVGMLVAMRLGLTTMDKTDAQLVRNRRVVNTRAILEGEIGGFVDTRANYRPQPEVLRQAPFLQAEAQSMRFVTSYSIEEAWRGRLRIAALQVIPGENSKSVRLIVNEMPYTGPEQAGRQIAGIEQEPNGPPIVRFAAIVASSQSFVLADRLAYCRFSWLEPLPAAPFQRWRPDWVRQDLLPLAVRIEMAPTETTPADLHVTTVTAPFRVKGAGVYGYEDRF